MHLNDQFFDACRDGDIIAVKKLLNDNPQIDISFRDEYAFRLACANGHLEVAKWLFHVRPQINISACDNYAFYFACLYGHLEIAVWLQTLKPYLYTIKYYFDGKYMGYYIRAKEEARWQQTKYLVWLSSTHSPNTKCVWFKLPNDISRYIIQNFI